MSSDMAIRCQNLTKYFARGGKVSLLGGLLGRSPARPLVALDHVSFALPRGSTLGIIGPNGSGKSTLLKLLAGVTEPDEGSIHIHGRIAPLIELGAGFHPELTGRENIALNAVLMGLSRAELKKRFDEIVDFAGLHEFLDTPVKKYSSGMLVRLGFSIAVHTDPDILLVDEVLAVGDEQFQRRCLHKFIEFRRQGKTTVVVSHDLGLISALCDQVLLLAQGKAVAHGSVDTAVGQYLQMCSGEAEGAAILDHPACTVIFNNGKVSLFRQGKELTKKWGLYTSFLVGNAADAVCLWQDSTRAVWRCTQLDANSMECRGEGITLPLLQVWRLQVDDRGTVHWRVTLHPKSSLFFERMQANVMLASAYDQWEVGEERGSFPLEFTSRDYHNWEVLRSLPGPHPMRAVAPDLPAITFASKRRDLLRVLVNSNLFFESRVLMFLDLEKKTLPVRQPYLFFEGEIQIDA